MAKTDNAQTIMGLSFFGVVNFIISPTVFLTSLTAQKDQFFRNWDVYVVAKNTGSGIAPQGDKRRCTDFLISNGRITIDSIFDTTPIAVGDLIYVIQPFVGENTYIVDQASNTLKQSSDAQVQTAALAYTKVKELAWTGKVGAARIRFDLRVDNILGTASAVVYKNGVPVTTNAAATPVFTVWTDATANYQTFTQDIGGLVTGDLIQIYALVSAAPRIAFVQNFRIYYDIVALPSVTAVEDAVYIDSINGVAGTADPIGTATQPVNNWADAQTIARSKNLTTFKLVHGVITLTADISGYKFIGSQYSDPAAAYIDNCMLLSGFTASKCSFQDINIYGVGASSLSRCGGFSGCSRVVVSTLPNCYAFYRCTNIVTTAISAGASFIDCGSVNATTITGSYVFINCRLIQATTMTDSGNIVNCGELNVTTLVRPVDINGCGIGTATTMDFTGAAGNKETYRLNGFPVTITNLTGAATTLEFSGDFTLIIAASCTAGTINVRGNITLINNALGTTVNDYTVTGSAAIIIVLLNNLISSMLTLNETGGTLTTDGLVQILWENNAPFGCFEPLTLKIDLTNQAAGDTIVVRAWERIRLGGGQKQFDHQAFAGAIPVGGDVLIYIDFKPNRFGVGATVEHTVVAAPFNIDWEIMRKE